MIAVRRLVVKSDDSKTLIFVNSKLDPVPREFLLKDFVISYSFMPLIAQNAEDPEADPIKIVIMRRYPAKWEIYIDAGQALGDNGFQFVEAIDEKDCLGVQGPPMDVVSGIITRYISFKSSR